MKPVLIYSMSVSVDGFIADREGAFGFTVPSDELFRFHTEQTRELGGFLLGRRLYETMLVWETDPSLRDDELRAAFADVWCAIPKVVFSRTLDSVQGNARLAEASEAEEAAAALDATDKDVGPLRDPQTGAGRRFRSDAQWGGTTESAGRMRRAARPASGEFGGRCAPVRSDYPEARLQLSCSASPMMMPSGPRRKQSR